jgi:pimeloyl-ACP methyl ester carboxylesterase
MNIKYYVKLLHCFFIIIGFLSLVFTLFNFTKFLYWDESIDLGSYKLSVRDWGNGKPTVIVEGGLAQEKHKYLLLSFFTSFLTRTISYDHAGIGNSTKSTNERLLPHYVEELRSLIQKKNIHPPLIFVGHSFGGHIMRYYTHLFPEDVMGLVFIDAPHEDWFQYIRANWSDDQKKKYFKWWFPENPDLTDTEILERLKYEENCDLLRGVDIPANIPVLVFTANNIGHFRKSIIGQSQDMQEWARLQSLFIKNVVDAEQIIDPEIGHFPFRDKPIMLISKINQFIKEIKDGKRGRSPSFIGN